MLKISLKKKYQAINPRLTEPIFVTQLTKGDGYPPPPSDFQNEPRARMMLILVPIFSLESPLNIDIKISTNMPSVWLLWRHNDMRPLENHEIWIRVQKYKKNRILAKIFTKNPFWSGFFAKKWKRMVNYTSYETWKQYLLK